MLQMFVLRQITGKCEEKADIQAISLPPSLWVEPQSGSLVRPWMAFSFSSAVREAFLSVGRSLSLFLSLPLCFPPNVTWFSPRVWNWFALIYMLMPLREVKQCVHITSLSRRNTTELGLWLCTFLYQHVSHEFNCDAMREGTVSGRYSICWKNSHKQPDKTTVFDRWTNNKVSNKWTSKSCRVPTM